MLPCFDVGNDGEEIGNWIIFSRVAVDKLKALRFDDLEEEKETVVLSYGKAHFRYNEFKCRDTYRKHCQDDGAHLYIQYSNLRTGDGQ